jgi:putative mRNA 3-end processing factor
MLIKTPKGLYCQAGDFFIDPSGPVTTAVITHAHSDHARRGSQRYYCAFSGLGLLKARVGKNILAHGIPYGDEFYLGPVKVSFHPAGHILGSAQVRLEHLGEVWVVSGDYKREADPSCEPFEVVSCDVFITEATFGTPKYIWNRKKDLAEEVWQWWQSNAVKDIHSVLFAYSLGKTQRILGLLEPYAKKKVLCHRASAEINSCYEAQGIKLAPYLCIDDEVESIGRGELFVVPSSFMKSPQAKLLGDRFETAFASGWMVEGPSEYSQGGPDKGFVISDHADWTDLVETVKQSQAKRVFVQHRGHGALVKHLQSLGFHAFPDSHLTGDTFNQLSFL